MKGRGRQQMTWAEKDARRQARYYGGRALVNHRNFLDCLKEAREWAKVDGAGSERVQRWLAVAEQCGDAAVSYARRAAHEARLAGFAAAVARAEREAVERQAQKAAGAQEAGEAGSKGAGR